MALAWLDMRWDQPSADQFYQMQTSAEVRMIRYLLAQKSEEVDINEFKLPFDRGGQQQEAEPTPMTADQATAIAMAKWFPLVGYKGT